MRTWTLRVEKFQLAFLLLLSLFGASGCYVLSQAAAQSELLVERRSINDLLAQPNLADPLRVRLLWTREILAFAKLQGLNSRGAYEDFVPLKRKSITFLVQASAADRFEQRYWNFPIVGQVPYLGFFSEVDRNAEASQLRSEGLDVAISGSAAFSSLGWFADPIFEPMLLRSRARLADLLFHELTHRTVWISGSSQFNEHLAECVGRHLTSLFLAHSDSELADFEASLRDEEVLLGWVKELKSSLEKIYELKETISHEELLRRKQETISRFKAESYLKTMSRNLAQYVSGKEWNNAEILAVGLYAPDYSTFENAFLRSGPYSSMGAFLQRLRKEVMLDPSTDPKQVLRRLAGV